MIIVISTGEALSAGGDFGIGGWTPVLALVEVGDRILQQVVDFTGGSGVKPATGLYVGEAGLVADPDDATNVRGETGVGSPGLSAWTAIEAIVVDGERRVKQVVDWIGGTGDKPAIGMYVGPAGYVALAAQATDVRGAQGAMPQDSDALTEGVNNKFFTSDRVRDVVLTGISFATGAAVVATDSILVGIGKLQKQFTDHFSDAKGHMSAPQKANPAITGPAGADSAGNLYDADGLPISVGGVELLPTTYRTDTAVIQKMHPPKESRIRSRGGVKQYSFYTGTPTVTNGTFSTTSDFAWVEPLGAKVDFTGGAPANLNAQWTGLNLPAYNENQAYVLTVYVGTDTLANGLSFTIADESGFRQQSWTLAGAAVKAGWNQIYLPAPTDTVADAASPLTPTGYARHTNFMSYVNNVGTANSMNGRAPTRATVALLNAPVGSFIVVDSFFTATKVKPVLCLTFDHTLEAIPAQGITDVFREIVLSAFNAAGLKGSLRYHGLYDGPTASQKLNIAQALASGWALLNGTFNRQSVLSNAADYVKDYMQNQNSASSYGFPQAEWGNPPGNNTRNDRKFARDFLSSIGIKYSKCAAYAPIVHSIYGTANPQCMSTLSLNLSTVTNAQVNNYISAMVATGTHCTFFQHTTEVEIVSRARYDSFLAVIKARVDAGDIDVYTVDEFTQVLEGAK